MLNCNPGQMPPQLAQMGITFRVALDASDTTAQRWAIPGRPHLALIGADGKVAWRGRPTDSGLRDAVAEALGKIPAPAKFAATEMPEAVAKSARTLDTGDFKRGVPALQKLAADDKAPAAQREAAKAVLGKVAELAQQRLAEIAGLEKEKRFAESWERLKSVEADFMGVPGVAERVNELNAAFAKDKDRQNGRKAGERYFKALDLLRKGGDSAKALRELEAVRDQNKDTAYGPLAGALHSQLSGK